jgi:hypothetical protein
MPVLGVLVLGDHICFGEAFEQRSSDTRNSSSNRFCILAGGTGRGRRQVAHILVLESHGDRPIQALLDAHRGLPHTGPNVAAVDLIKLGLPSDRAVIGPLPLFDMAQHRRQIALFAQVLRRQRRPEALVRRVGKDRDALPFHLG